MLHCARVRANTMSDSSSRNMWRQTIYPTRDGSFIYFDMTIFLAITSIFLLSFWLLKKAKEFYKERSRMIELAAKLPGPPSLPLVGNALQFACGPEETLNRIVEIVKRYDTPMHFWLGPKLFVILAEPRDYEVILSCQKASYKDPVYRFMEPFVGQGLVSGSGPMHRSHRKMIMPMLNNKALNEYVEHFDFHSRICADLLDEKVDSEIPFDIQPYLIHCTFDMIFDTILGIPGSSQKEGHKELVYWTETMYELIHLRMMKVWLHPDCIYYRTALARRQNEGQKVIHGFVESAVARKKKEHFALQRGAITSDRPRLMLLEQIIDHCVKNDFMTDEQIRDEIYTLFTAAQDTTAVISSFALLNLAMNQDIQDKVRDEIKKIVGDEEVKIEHLSELKYLEMVIKETTRLYPIAPMMVRQATGDIDLEKCTIPKGCSILMVPFVTQRNEKYWSDPDKFIPERFLPENSSTRHPYAYAAFSGGLRGCIGQKYAIMCLKTIMVHIVRRFRLTTTQTLETLRLKTDISIRSRDGYMVKIERI